MKTILFFLMLVPHLFFSQAPAIQWDKTIGGGSEDACTKVIQTKDGGYLTIGYTRSGISFDKTSSTVMPEDYWIIKTDNMGVIEWQKNYGGMGEDSAWVVFETSDNGYIINGMSSSAIFGDVTCNPTSPACFWPYGIPHFNWLLKLDNSGNIVWQKAIEYGIIDIVEIDGGYVVGGTAGSFPYTISFQNYYIAKVDTNFNIIWEKTIAGNIQDYYSKMIPSNDGGYIIAGRSYSPISIDKTMNPHGVLDNYGFYNSDIWILKISEAGQIVWQKSIGGDGGDGLYNTKKNLNNTYTLIGSSTSSISGDRTVPLNNAQDFWIVDIDNSGNVINQNAFGFDYATKEIKSIEKDADGNFLICGSKYWNTTNSEIYVDKLDPLGNLIWTKQINGNDTDRISSISKTSDGGYILGCYSNSSISGDKTDSARDNSMYYWLVKLAPDNLSTTRYSSLKANIYPNPTSGNINVNFGQLLDKATLTLTNILGQIVLSKTITNLDNTIYEINEPSGIYFLEIESQNKSKQVLKIIKQ